MYSHWQRLHRNQQIEPDISYEVFLAGRYQDYPFSNRDYLLLFLRLWQSTLSSRDHIIVRFEDYKSEPHKTLQRVLDFIEVKVLREDCNRVISASDFTVVKAIEDQFVGSFDNPKHYSNRAGLAFEYRDSYTSAMHEAVGERYNPLYQWLGYESYYKAKIYSEPVEHSTEQINRILQAMDAGLLDESSQRQLQTLLAQHTTDISLQN